MNKQKLYEDLMVDISKRVKKHLSESFFDDMFDEQDNEDDSLLSGIQTQEDLTHELTIKTLQKIGNDVPLLIAYSQQTGYNKCPRGFKHIIPDNPTEPQYFEYISKTTSNISGKQCAATLADIGMYHSNRKWKLYDYSYYNFLPICFEDFKYKPIKQEYIIDKNLPLIPIECDMNTTLSDIEDFYKEYGCEQYFETNKNNISSILQKYKSAVNNIENSEIKRIISKSNLYEYVLVSPDEGLMLTKKMVLKYNPKHQTRDAFANNSKFFIRLHNNNDEDIYFDLSFEYKLTFTGAVPYDELIQYKTPEQMKLAKIKSSIDIVEDYDADSFVVFGYTYKIKEQIKELGGKFSTEYKTSTGEKQPGWKIPKRNREKFEQIFE